MNTNLPIASYKEQIINSINNNDTLIITAETGSGKSTQVPQYLYEAGYNVIVTQPRRIACVSLAERLDEEMNLGQNITNGVVAYHTAFESTRTPDTKILFCTDGLQMARGIKDSKNTVLVLDEVHEWNLNIETLVAWIKRFRKEGHNLKVILMSATIELQELSKFYGYAEYISVPGRTYDVRMLHSMDTIEEIAANYANEGKNVLVFVEGKNEIKSISDDLSDTSRSMLSRKVEVIPLHGQLTVQEQNKCFQKYDCPKIVIATNIAQTSITIPDIDVVVDSGQEKRIEIRNGIEGLFTHPISKADCLQRAGRAGRTKDGIYVLCSNTKLEDRDEFNTPEIQRLVLDKVCLKLMSVDINPLTLEFFHQPAYKNLLESIETLESIGAIKNLTVTNLGKRIIKFPVSVRFARILIEAEKYNCTNKMIKAIAIMETGSLVNRKATTISMHGFEMPVTYSTFTKEHQSDILAEIDIYDNILAFKYKNLKEAGLNKKIFKTIKKFVDKLKDSIQSEIEITDEPMNYSDFIKCIFSGMSDRIFYNNYSYTFESLTEADELYYHLNKGSVVSHAQYVIGIPKTITSTHKIYGYKDTMNLITMASAIDKSNLLELIADKLNIEYDESDIDYDSRHNCFIIPYVSKYNGCIIDRGYKTISEDDDKFSKLSEKFKDIIARENAKRVKIGNNVYEIEYSLWNDNHPIIYIDSEEDIMNSDITTLRDPKGQPVLFKSYYQTNHNLALIRESIMRRKIEFLKDSIIDNLPKGKTGSTKIIINDYLPQIGKKDCSILEYNIIDFKYVGLSLNKESAELTVFNDEDSMISATNDTLKFMIKKTIKQEYNDKKFIVKQNGKRIETKKSIAAKEEFHEYCQEIIAETTKDNFEEQLDFLKEIYTECISQIA